MMKYIILFFTILLAFNCSETIIDKPIQRFYDFQKPNIINTKIIKQVQFNTGDCWYNNCFPTCLSMTLQNFDINKKVSDIRNFNKNNCGYWYFKNAINYLNDFNCSIKSNWNNLNIYNQLNNGNLIILDVNSNLITNKSYNTTENNKHIILITGYKIVNNIHYFICMDSLSYTDYDLYKVNDLITNNSDLSNSCLIVGRI